MPLSDGDALFITTGRASYTAGDLNQDGSINVLDVVTLVNIVLNVINLTFKIEETEKFLVERINIFGNNITRENVIRNQLEIDEGDPFSDLLIKNLKIKGIKIILGGKTRADSAYKALKSIEADNVKNIMIHDAARPNFSVKLFCSAVS